MGVSRVTLLVTIVMWLLSNCARVQDGGVLTGSGGGTTVGSTGGQTGTGGAVFGGLGGMGGQHFITGTIGSAGTSGGCSNLQCQKTTCTQGACKEQACPAGVKTTVSGTVYDPAGRVPLYNIVVYVPNVALDPFTEGVSCQKCDGTATGAPVASGLTDATGHFVLQDVPVGANIPLVIQIGKWRRQVMIPNVAACTDTPITDPNLTRLPRNQLEGHIPQIALTTGHADALDCLLRKIGIADSEFTNDSGTGRVHMYVGGDGNAANQGSARLASGAVFADAYKTLFANPKKMLAYDVLILQCESSQLTTSKDPYLANMKMYADAGGRIFDEHLHSYWIRKGPAPWPTTGLWIGAGAPLPTPITATLDTSFPKGVSFANWLVSVGASTTRGQIPIVAGQNSVNGVTAPTQRWIYTGTPTSVQFLTFNTPVEAPPTSQCGRVVFTDMHVGTGAGMSHPDIAFPTGCSTSPDLTPQEKALEFMLFDLSSCIQPDIVTPVPPPITIQ